MGRFGRITLLLLLTIGGLASCNKVDRSTQVESRPLTDVERRGQAFREKVLMQWKSRPARSYTDMADLCRETFTGKSLQEANALMRAAGQVFDLTKTSQAAQLIPPGTTPYVGGLGLHSSLISGASFNVIFYLTNTGSVDSSVVEDVSCGVRETSL